MSKIDWNRYTKQELVEILDAMDEQVWLVERFDPQDQGFGVKICSCDLGSEKLPKCLLDLRERAAKRALRENPFARFLRRPTRRDRSRKETG